MLSFQSLISNKLLITSIFLEVISIEFFQYLQSWAVLDSRFHWKMRMEMAMLVPFMLEVKRNQLMYFLILDLISLLSLVICAMIQSLANRKKMFQFSIQLQWPMFIVAKIIENVKAEHINQKLHQQQNQCQVLMMKNSTMDLPNFKESFIKTVLASIKIKHHVLILNSLHFIKLKDLMIQTVFLD